MHHLLEALLENHTVQILSIGNQKALTHCVHNAKLFLKVLQQRRVWGLEMGETRWEHDTLYGLLEGMWPQHGERTTAVAFGFIDDRCGNDEKLIRRFKDITREQRRADKAARAAAVAAGRWLETPSAQWLDPANFYWISRSHMVTRFAWSPKQEAEFWRSQGYAVPLVKRNMQAHNPRAWSNPHIRQYSDMLPGGCDEATQTNKKWGTSRESATAAQVIAWLADDLPYPAFPGIDKIYWDIYTTPFIMAIRADGAAPASVKRLSCLLLEIGAEAWMRSRGRELDPSAAHTRGRRVTWQGDDAMYEQWSRGLAQLVLDDELGKLDGDVEARREAYRRLVRHAVWLWTSNLQETVEALWGGGGLMRMRNGDWARWPRDCRMRPRGARWMTKAWATPCVEALAPSCGMKRTSSRTLTWASRLRLIMRRPRTLSWLLRPTTPARRRRRRRLGLTPLPVTIMNLPTTARSAAPWAKAATGTSLSSASSRGTGTRTSPPATARTLWRCFRARAPSTSRSTATAW